jgi:hypothetical protein
VAIALQCADEKNFMNQICSLRHKFQYSIGPGGNVFLGARRGLPSVAHPGRGGNMIGVSENLARGDT